MAESLDPNPAGTKLAEQEVSASKLPAGRIAFAYPDFTIYQAARFFIVAALEMQSVAVGWQMYEITRRPLDLGLIGLAQFLPGMLLFLVSGHVADRFDRRKVVTLCYVGFAVSSGLLWAIAWRGSRSVNLIYAAVVLVGVVRAFNAPVSRALLPQLVPEEHFPNAVAWNASIFQAATILGPSAGGFLYALSGGPSVVYATAVITSLAAVFSTLRISLQTQARSREPVTWNTVLAGFHYIWSHKLVLGSISLDMFAVLLGGAVALLPIYASEILRPGPGAWPAAQCPRHRCDCHGDPGRASSLATPRWPYHAVVRGGFGVCTIIFGLSRSLALSLVALFLLGASDMISVIIRSILVQLATPDEMRGRVNAVDMIFIGVSNELGQFESGLTAHWFGTVPADVFGGSERW